jgi:hypothetical protein
LFYFALRTTTLVLVAVTAIIGLDAEARADIDTEPLGGARQGPPSPSPIAWGLRLSAGVGGGSLPSASDGGPTVGFSLEGEYWLSRNVGVGAQLSAQWISTFNFMCETCTSDSIRRVSLAPAIVLRGNNPRSFPTASLALGYSLGHEDASHSCDPADQRSDCQESSWSGDKSGLFGSLTAAWLFHGTQPPGSAAFAIGPLLRLDWFSYDGLQKNVAVFTIGLTIGVGVGKK